MGENYLETFRAKYPVEAEISMDLDFSPHNLPIPFHFSVYPNPSTGVRHLFTETEEEMNTLLKIAGIE